MVARDIQNFYEIRTKARAYFCYLYSKNLPNRTPEITPEAIAPRLQKIMGDLKDAEGYYILDQKGVQITPTFLPHGKQIDDDIGLIRSDRAYYYRAVREKRCTITDPYPSLITQELTVTVSQPVFDEKTVLKYVACMDISLETVLKIAHPMPMQSFFGKSFRFGYMAFTAVLGIVAFMLFVKGIDSFLHADLMFGKIDIENVFKATILLTLALAIFDLVKTLFEEEVLGQSRQSVGASDPHKTMVRFLGSIIIALSIEALMLVFKFAMTEPAMLINAIYIIGGVSLLIISLAIYIKFTKVKVEDE